MIGCFIVLVLLGTGALFARDARDLEYQVKAAFIYNFARFTDWPETAFADRTSALVLGVLGTDPFGDNLEQTVKDKQVNQHPILIRRGATLADIGPCHVLFISSPEMRNLPHHLRQLAGKPVLTIAEAEDFRVHGGMIRLFKKQDTISFEINTEATTKANLKVSSKLLRLAENHRDGR